ncbi:hypothetical protein DPM13_01435 [Paracoccus mutanolyticus]|uniref:Transposase IS4-like domain-containing protein n=1 Tax=Paracoccus mutanolyticus TaxID=1499308 RepID=A0ABN5M6W2_9RHOB|nr:hypothetical protein DPM13_01435 [Paracoccus mutanolyticus]
MRRGFGIDRRVHVLLDREGWGINVKKVSRSHQSDWACAQAMTPEGCEMPGRAFRQDRSALARGKRCLRVLGQSGKPRGGQALDFPASRQLQHLRFR